MRDRAANGPGRKWPGRLAGAVLAAALVAATWPAWRVLMLGERATFEELLMLVCSTRTAVPSSAGSAAVRPSR
ncbi:MAG: hypothetical protein V4754_08440 [Pseudomonadota bacterium]